MERKLLRFTPQWPGVIEGMTVRIAEKNLWRVEPEYEIDDLLHEGYRVFVRIAERYPRVNTPSHFTALYRTSYVNEITHLANRRTRLVQMLCAEDQSTNVIERAPSPDYARDLDWLLDLDAAAPDIKRVVARAESMMGVYRARRWQRRTLETLADMFQRYSNSPDSPDLYNRFKAWISGENYELPEQSAI